MLRVGGVVVALAVVYAGPAWARVGAGGTCGLPVEGFLEDLDATLTGAQGRDPAVRDPDLHARGGLGRLHPRLVRMAEGLGAGPLDGTVLALAGGSLSGRGGFGR